MRLGYDLTIEQSQKLIMTPELIQAIQILQFNTQELEEYVQNELMDNPVLELDSALNVKLSEGKTSDYDDETSVEDDFKNRIRENDVKLDDISYRQWQYSKDSDDNETSFENYTSKEETLLDNLLFQLSLSSLEGLDRKIGRYIIEALDDNGYLSLKTDDIAEDFKVSKDRVEDVLDTIQTFDPPGVGARCLKECLCIQLRERNLLEDSIEYVILHYLEEIGDNKLGKIAKEMDIPVSDVQIICDLIKSLEPKPGRKYASQSEVRYIIPDVIIRKDGDFFEIDSNDDVVPNLVVSNYYTNLLKTNDDTELIKYLTDKYDQANWLIKSIEQRKRTISKVVNSVLVHQKDFFLRGPKYLKTLTLKEVADDIGVHESTVSRSINGKYMQTPRGMFEIKYFFSSGVNDINGEGMSSNSVKIYIKEIIDSEDTSDPFSDQAIVSLLSEKGIEISRRTVAKYRESMNILSSSKRKKF